MLSFKFGKNSIFDMTTVRSLAFFLVPLIVFIFATAAPVVSGQKEPGELEAKIIFETNYTDRDTGIQIFTDGDPWRMIRIFDPNGKLLFDVKGKGRLKKFGLTELFSESNEPNWDEEMSLSEIIARFPEGEYVFKGKSIEQDKLIGEATLSHNLPCAPDEDSLSPSENTVSAASEIVIE